jgi:putative membrane protein
MFKPHQLFAGLVLATALSTGAMAAEKAVSAKTEKFITNATIGNMFEVDTSKIALDRSDDAELRNFATMMVKDHTMALKNMKAALPSDADPRLGTEYDAKHAQKLEELREVSDEKFDAAYVAVQKDAHKEAVGLFSDYAKTGDEKTLREFAATTLPRLKDHQTHVNSFKLTNDGYTATKPMKHSTEHLPMTGDNPKAARRDN